MRIGDTARLSVDHILGITLFLCTQKTGVAVRSTFPGFVPRELAAAPESSEGYFSWSCQPKLHSAVGKWQPRLQRLFNLAEIKGGHAHRFPDAFSTSLLQAGVTLDLEDFIQARLVGAVGIEPTTFGLKGRCSATELRP
jgi:integrase